MNEAGWELPPVTLCQLGQPSVKLCQVSIRKPFKRCDLEYLVHPQCCDHHRATAAAFFWAWNWNLSKSPVPVFHEVLDLESVRQCRFAINRSLQPGRLSSKPVLLYIYIHTSLSLYLQCIYIYRGIVRWICMLPVSKLQELEICMFQVLSAEAFRTDTRCQNMCWQQRQEVHLPWWCPTKAFCRCQPWDWKRRGLSSLGSLAAAVRANSNSNSENAASFNGALYPSSVDWLRTDIHVEVLQYSLSQRHFDSSVNELSWAIISGRPKFEAALPKFEGICTDAKVDMDIVQQTLGWISRTGR